MPILCPCPLQLIIIIHIHFQLFSYDLHTRIRYIQLNIEELSWKIPRIKFTSASSFSLVSSCNHSLLTCNVSHWSPSYTECNTRCEHLLLVSLLGRLSGHSAGHLYLVVAWYCGCSCRSCFRYPIVCEEQREMLFCGNRNPLVYGTSN